MNAPPNDARPVIYQTATGAQSAALRLATQDSPSRTARASRFVANVYGATEGGSFYMYAPANVGGDWQVTELSAVEFARLEQSGMRRAVADLYERAAAHDAAVELSSLKSVRYMHGLYAAECRDQAREIERLIVVGSVRSTVGVDAQAVSL